MLVQLLSLDTYAYHTLLGMIASVGGLTESTVSVSDFVQHIMTKTQFEAIKYEHVICGIIP